MDPSMKPWIFAPTPQTFLKFLHQRLSKGDFCSLTNPSNPPYFESNTSTQTPLLLWKRFHLHFPKSASLKTPMSLTLLAFTYILPLYPRMFFVFFTPTSQKSPLDPHKSCTHLFRNFKEREIEKRKRRNDQINKTNSPRIGHVFVLLKCQPLLEFHNNRLPCLNPPRISPNR